MTKSPFPLAQDFYAPKNRAIPMIGTRKIEPPPAPQRRGAFANSPFFYWFFNNNSHANFCCRDRRGNGVFRNFFPRMPYLPARQLPPSPSQCGGLLFADGKEPAENPPALLSLQKLGMQNVFSSVYFPEFSAKSFFAASTTSGCRSRRYAPSAMAWAP